MAGMSSTAARSGDRRHAYRTAEPAGAAFTRSSAAGGSLDANSGPLPLGFPSARGPLWSGLGDGEVIEDELEEVPGTVPPFDELIGGGAGHGAPPVEGPVDHLGHHG